MAIVRITEIPENRRMANVDLELEVRSFRGATAEIAKNLRQTANSTFRNQVMRLWSRHGRSGGFAFRNGLNNDSWVLFEYIECGGYPEEMPHDTSVRKSLHASGFHQYCNKGGSQ